MIQAMPAIYISKKYTIEKRICPAFFKNISLLFNQTKIEFF